MDKREELARIACWSIYGYSEEPCGDGDCDCVMRQANLEVVDAILDALMEPGEGALHEGISKWLYDLPNPAVSGSVAQAVHDNWQAMLRHIREGGE